MARGNHVDGVEVIERFGFIIIVPAFKWQSFQYYSSIYISKNGMLIGKWDKYKDYLTNGMDVKAKLIRRTPSYLFFKI
jgi:hypothetical protein